MTPTDADLVAEARRICSELSRLCTDVPNTSARAREWLKRTEPLSEASLALVFGLMTAYPSKRGVPEEVLNAARGVEAATGALATVIERLQARGFLNESS